MQSGAGGTEFSGDDSRSNQFCRKIPSSNSIQSLSKQQTNMLPTSMLTNISSSEVQSAATVDQYSRQVLATKEAHLPYTPGKSVRESLLQLGVTSSPTPVSATGALGS